MTAALIGALMIGLSLGLLGSGGSILTVPILVYLLGQPEKIAITGSLAIVGGIALAGALQAWHRGLVAWRSILWFGLPGMAGTWLGSTLSRWMSGELQLFIFAIVMLLASVMMFRRKDSGQELDRSHEIHPALLLAGGVGVGLLTGVVGIGGGFLIVPALVLMGGLPMRRAIGTSLWIISLTAAIGLFRHLQLPDTPPSSLDWRLIGLFIVVGAAGSFAGHTLSARLPQKTLRKLFAVFLVLMGIYIVWHTLPQVLAGHGGSRA